jgi:hypothetical protein
LKYAEELARGYGQAPAAVREATGGSRFARALAAALAKTAGVSSSVTPGDEGFAIDLALTDSSLGVLCDGSRYERARDRVEWDGFRSEVLEQQGWKLRRVWTPQFFRDPAAAVAAIAKAARGL